ncbi:MAG TPA: Kazal-type serine protease inhibitor family protein [Caulobacteraceae bacterium]|nr:Kazal-type serine protease inhibitor family protein [Caulobacteraceae bacterium]
MTRALRIGLAGLLAAFTVGCESTGSAEPPPSPAPGRTPAAEGGMCGGIAGFQCGEGLYCRMEATHPDAAGVCRKRPQMCTREYRPVCGRDGKTYGNACTAAAAGVDVAHEGECQG